MVEPAGWGLTAREVECLRGVAQHKRTKVIAAELMLAPKTVDTYLASAAKKLGVADRDSAVRVWLEADGERSGLSPSVKTEMVEGDGMGSGRRVGGLPWPFPTREKPNNDLTIAQSLIWIVVLAALMLAAATFYLLGVRMLYEHL